MVTKIPAAIFLDKFFLSFKKPTPKTAKVLIHATWLLNQNLFRLEHTVNENNRPYYVFKVNTDRVQLKENKKRQKLADGQWIYKEENGNQRSVDYDDTKAEPKILIYSYEEKVPGNMGPVIIELTTSQQSIEDHIIHRSIKGWKPFDVVDKVRNSTTIGFVTLTYYDTENEGRGHEVLLTLSEQKSSQSTMIRSQIRGVYTDVRVIDDY